MGTAITVAVGVVFFKEPLVIIKVISVGLIVAGVVGFKLSQAH
ncbi:guanidinium exporter (fragment) [Desulfarculales bacterium]